MLSAVGAVAINNVVAQAPEEAAGIDVQGGDIADMGFEAFVGKEYIPAEADKATEVLPDHLGRA